MSLISELVPSLRARDQRPYGWGRVDAFIDAVYAIAATLLVLELRPPEGEPGELGQALLDQWPTYLIYALGFIQILGGWNAMRRVSAWSTGIDYYAMLLAMAAMLTFSLQPFTLSVLADAVHDRDDFTAAVRLLAIVLTISMTFFSGLMVYLRWRGLFRRDLDAQRFRVAYLLAVTVAAWPLLALALTWVIGPWALAVIVFYFVLTLAPIDALPADQDDVDAL